MSSKDRIIITKGKHPVKMISFSKDNYYEVLKARLHGAEEEVKLAFYLSATDSPAGMDCAICSSIFLLLC